MQALFLIGILAFSYAMVISKRMPALVRSFRYQSFFLFLLALSAAIKEGNPQVYIVAGLLFLLKVIAIPILLLRIVKKIKTGDNLGLFINSQLSLIIALVFTYFAWIFATVLAPQGVPAQHIILMVAFTVAFSGLLLMMFRMKALAQIIGLLVMENGIFLFALSVSGGMPFFVEIAVFFDVFVSVIILGVFVYRINKLFTHIDVNKLSRLKG